MCPSDSASNVRCLGRQQASAQASIEGIQGRLSAVVFGLPLAAELPHYPTLSHVPRCQPSAAFVGRAQASKTLSQEIPIAMKAIEGVICRPGIARHLLYAPSLCFAAELERPPLLGIQPQLHRSVEHVEYQTHESFRLAQG